MSNDGVLLTTPELAARWRLSARTLEGWRRRLAGPPFIRLPNRKVRYRAEDIAVFEARGLNLTSWMPLVVRGRR